MFIKHLKHKINILLFFHSAIVNTEQQAFYDDVFMSWGIVLVVDFL